MNTEEFQRHLHMMKTPMKWPAMALPIVKRNSEGRMPDTAFMVAFGSNSEPKIYLGNMWDIPHGFVNRRDLEDKFEVKSFDDFEGILDAGWEVD